jgi:Lon protease-like protein
MADELAMFPLGSVLFPSLVLPLHVFEPRYRAMVEHLLGTEDRDPEFGVVLIERGSEVGGDDVRTNVGTVARIVEAGQMGDGRYVLTTFGVRRIRVVEWLPDDPWPRAMVEHLDDDPPAGRDASERWAAVQGRLRRVLGLAAELGEASVPTTVELADDPALGSYQAAAVAPLGPADQFAVLCAEGADDRLELLDGLLSDAAELLEARLSMG